MNSESLLKGILVGFSIAAPVGPIGLLCIQRTLAQGRLFGLLSGLGAATADMFYGLIAGLGLTTISGYLLASKNPIQTLGILFLFYLGVKTMISPASQPASTIRRGSLLYAYSSTLFLTLTNPLTILSFLGIMSGTGIGLSSLGYAPVALFVSGVFLGSSIWWLLLSQFVGIFRSRLHPRVYLWVNRGAGVLILAFAVYLAFELLRRL